MCDGIERHFPFEKFRIGQRDLLRHLCRGLRGGGVTLVEAPNGIGKTAAALTAMEYLSRSVGGPFLYLVRTHSQIDRVLAECRRFEDLRVAALRGKKELCLNWRVSRIRNYRFFDRKCNELRSRGKCPYARRRAMMGGELEKCFDPLILDEGSCPYYGSVGALARGNFDVVVASHTYLLDDGLRTFLRRVVNGRAVLVDEAHNLKREWLSNHLLTVEEDSLNSLIGCKKLSDTLDYFRRSRLNYIALPRRYAVSIMECEGPVSEEGRELLSWLRGEILRANRVFLSRGDGLIIFRRPETTLENVLSEYDSAVLISGTWGGKSSEAEFLTPVHYYSVPVQRWGNVRTYISGDFSTKFEERSPYEYYRLATTLAELSKRVAGNIGVFTASYDIIRGLLDAGLGEMVDRRLFVERRGMSETERLLMIKKYKDSWREGALLLGVQGGRNSEGEDFPGPQMSASVVVGLQFMRPGILRDLTLYLWKEQSRLLVPELLNACRTAIQAAARPVRSPDDDGFILLADSRFKACSNFLPEWMRRVIRIASLEEVPYLADEFFSSGHHLSRDTGVPLHGIGRGPDLSEGRSCDKGRDGVAEIRIQDRLGLLRGAYPPDDWK